MRFSSLLIVAVLTTAPLVAAEPDALVTAADRATKEFTQRLVTATRELAAAREKIAAEKTPLLTATRSAEARIAALGPQIAELETAHATAEETRQRLLRDGTTLQRNLNYLNTLGRDGLKSFGDALVPGESAVFAERTAALTHQFEESARGADVSAALETVELSLERLRRQIGGYAVPGASLVGNDNRMIKGTLAFVGPEVFFRSDDGTVTGSVRTREGSNHPVTYPLPQWSPEKARAFFEGSPGGTIVADSTGGKALRLRQTRGTLRQHIHNGGPIAYVIIVTGMLALALAVQKWLETRQLQVGTPQTVERLIPDLLEQSASEARRSLEAVPSTARELFLIGLRHAEKPKEVLEEHLFAFTLRQRQFFERRLPLLTVIATASPLLGLLGTVMGMVKTFALITVFGTGNAAKLSSGISEVLVTTELGLIVAVPALVAHGFLAHHIHKKLAYLERYAVDFAAAAGDTRDAEPSTVNLTS